MTPQLFRSAFPGLGLMGEILIANVILGLMTWDEAIVLARVFSGRRA